MIYARSSKSALGTLTAAGLLLLAQACSSSAERESLLPTHVRAINVTLERAGFRLLHPENWQVDTEDPAHDPDHYLVLLGPEGASIALMIHDEPADPAALVEGMSARHGLSAARERPFQRWGRYDGVGVDIRGTAEGDLPGGMRLFASSLGSASFLIAESYLESGYALARNGFDAVELSFTVLGQEQWPAVSLGTPIKETGELLLVRRAFQLRFPDDWRVDASSPDYDPDALFTLVSPYESCWAVLQVLDAGADADATLAEAAAGLGEMFQAVDREERFHSWGMLDGAGVELGGRESGLPATLRVFVHDGAEQTLVVTEFWYDELAGDVRPGFLRLASSFEFRR